jgi:AraC-like DNA-binding protein
MLFEPRPCYFWEGEWPANQVEPMRRIYETELVYATHGTYDLEIESKTYRMKAGMVALIPPAVWHESRSTGGLRVVRHCVHFEWQPGLPRPDWQLQAFVGQPFHEALVRAVPASVAPQLPLIRSIDGDPEVRQVLELCLGGLRRGHPLGGYLLWPLLMSLLAMTDPERKKRAAPMQRHTHVTRAATQVRDYIDIHYREPHGYEVYRELTGLSASHLCQAFKRLFGATPFAYLTDLRLSQAHRLLGTDSRGVAEIARAVGFHDPNYFARAFHRRFGCSPTEIRCRSGRLRDHR